MNNIISADFFRIRKGAALRNTIIGLLITVLLMAVIISLTQNQVSTLVLENTDNMTPAEIAEIQQELASVQSEVSDIENGANFVTDMIAQYIIPLFFLPIILAVFCADFSAGTYRNTLSYESNRSKVYMAKLLLSTALCLGLTLVLALLSVLFGGIVFGFTGFSGAFFRQMLTTLVLQLPVCLAVIATGHLLISFTKKSGTTIAVFLLGMIILGIVFQLLPTLFPSVEWLPVIDPLTAGQMLSEYATMPIKSIAILLGSNIIIALGTTMLGMAHYRKVDMP